MVIFAFAERLPTSANLVVLWSCQSLLIELKYSMCRLSVRRTFGNVFLPFYKYAAQVAQEKLLQYIHFNRHSNTLLIEHNAKLINELKTKTNQVKTEMDQVKTKTNQVKTEMDQVKTKTNQVKKEMNQVKTKTNQVKTEMNQMKTEIKDLHKSGIDKSNFQHLQA